LPFPHPQPEGIRAIITLTNLRGANVLGMLKADNAGADETRYRVRMALTVTGLLIGIPLFLVILFIVLAAFFNPFGFS
jgi:hypothetical protein